MPKTARNQKSLRLLCDDMSDEFIVGYASQEKPFREGITIGIANRDFNKDVEIMLEDGEAKQLRDFLNEFYPE